MYNDANIFWNDKLYLWLSSRCPMYRVLKAWIIWLYYPSSTASFWILHPNWCLHLSQLSRLYSTSLKKLKFNIVGVSGRLETGTFLSIITWYALKSCQNHHWKWSLLEFSTHYWRSPWILTVAKGIKYKYKLWRLFVKLIPVACPPFLFPMCAPANAATPLGHITRVDCAFGVSSCRDVDEARSLRQLHSIRLNFTDCPNLSAQVWGMAE